MSKLLWQPSEEFINESNLTDYMNWLNKKYNKDFSDYSELWNWSTTNIKDFWESMWEYFEIISENGYAEVLSGEKMPYFKWFKGAKLNYAAHVLRNSNDENPAIIYTSESHPIRSISWAELEDRIARFQEFLRNEGVQKGDCVVGYLANIPHATVAFLATIGLGATWSCCSPDFGVESVVSRFSQLTPKVLVAVDGYSYNNKIYDKTKEVREIGQQLPSVTKIVWADSVLESRVNNDKEINWFDAIDNNQTSIELLNVEFDHPLWVLFSSGTTGTPKAIVHGHGGNLMEHLKYHAFHNDTKKGERFFWFTTTGWMMWNYLQGSMLMGATMVLYDGSPALSSLDILWDLVEKAKINHFGTSAPYIVACMKRGLVPSEHDLSCLRSIGSTGAPLPPEAFEYVYSKIKKDLWLCSMSGGTDVCTAFVGGNPTFPVYEGEIQCRALGVAMESWNESGNPIKNEVGEMVITEPMPSMPISFLNDPGDKRYLDSYFNMFPDIWRHGDWVKITPHNSIVILGRSDATLNRHGIRIGTAEIYNILNKIDGIIDALVVNIEKSNGDHFMPLFVQLDQEELTEELVREIKVSLRKKGSPRHVPDVIVLVKDIPKTISGKKMEAPVKKILMGIDKQKAINLDAMKNPESVEFFLQYAETIN